ncbi:transcription antiterminator [Paenibacillus albicereus]|uniref:Transcription antiterminator n=1 Tax=Paenibacillus albicereus TaxID=2726185 RepID=A0A6H2GVK2_9BACL|nr:BglG family transcription antiterminator [Paenibacillus albicereus]QJC51453.1 transcription antiterminator [Paenibacillus albicereus]
MELTHRMRRMLDLLLQPDAGDITVAEIARRIQVSSRTVHRELDALEGYLHRQGVRLQRKAGSGLRLDVDEERLRRLKRELAAPEGAEFSPEERQLHLLARLLGSEEPIKLFGLASEMKVTVTTVSADLDDLEAWIAGNRLELVRRRGYGIELSGSEIARRDAIRALQRLRLDDLALLSLAEERPRHPIDELISALSGSPRMPAIEEVLWRWEEEQDDHPLREQAYTDLLVRLAIAAERIGRGHPASLEELEERRGYYRRPASESERLCDLLQKETGLPYGEAERHYTQHLLELAARRSADSLPAEDLELAAIVRQLIRRMEEVGGADYASDRSLRDGLYAHLQAALERLAAGQRIRNPLLEAVRKDYADLFAQVREASEAALRDWSVPEEEIAFLVMHFGASLERRRQLRQPLRAIIVCTSGIGSSRMLATRLAKEFPQLDLVQQASWYEASRIPAAAYDIIISTVDLPIAPSRYIKLSPLLDAGEAQRLREFILARPDGGDEADAQPQGAAPGPLDETLSGPSPPPPSERNGPEAAMHSVSRAAAQCARLLEEFRVLRLKAADGALRPLLMEACGRPELAAAVRDAAAIVDRLIEREAHGTQLLPGTDLALFHTRSGEVSRPVLALFELEHPLRLDPDPGAPALRRFLLMLAPLVLARESLEVLSEVSASLLDSGMIEVLASGREERIRADLAVHLKAYLNHKLDRE